MAVTKTIVKKVYQQAVVKFISVGGGSANITMAELKTADETIDFANTQPRVTINGLFVSNDNDTVISRAGANVLYITGGQADKWDFSQAWGFTLDENANAQIDVNFVGDGTLILILAKKGGYEIPDRQNLKDYQR